jgi:predicted HicB family RNase H-like nuclease
VTENKKRKKPGRPKLAKEHRYSRIVPIRFKDEDLKLFAKAAKANKQNLSEWVRATLRDAAKE